MRTATLFVLASTVLGLIVCVPAFADQTSAKATLAYWDAVVAPSKHPCGLMKAIEGAPEPSPATCAEIFRQMNAHLVERRDALSALPMLGVDPIATEYAALRVKTIGETMDFMSDVASFEDERASLTSGADTSGRFLLALMMHANDQEDVLLNAFKEGVKETGEVTQELAKHKSVIVQKVAALGRTASLLEQSEMEARAKLTQKYNAEFKPGTHVDEKAVPLANENRIDAATLQRHLLGQSAMIGKVYWTFEAGEFVTFDVVNAEAVGDANRYQIATHIRGIRSGAEHDVTVQMVYHLEKASQVLRVVTATGR